jgi:hypothetical protein
MRQQYFYIYHGHIISEYYELPEMEDKMLRWLNGNTLRTGWVAGSIIVREPGNSVPAVVEFSACLSQYAQPLLD